MVISLTLPGGEIVAVRAVPAIDRRVLFIYLAAIDEAARSVDSIVPAICLWRETEHGIYKNVEKVFASCGIPIADYDNETFVRILGAIATANAIDEKPARKRDPEDEIIIESSGDPEADLIADMARIFTMDGAIAAYRFFDINTIYNICDRYSKASEDPEKLKERAARKRAGETLKSAADRLEQLGIDSFDSLDRLDEIDINNIL